MKVTIIIPIYNAENFLKDCIESSIRQTYKNIEIILVDDGSTDQSRKIEEKYAKIDQRIKLIKQENLGVNIARKKGIEQSSGDYILFVDADDWIEENTVEILVSKLKKFESDIIRFRYVIKPDNIKQKILFENRDVTFSGENKKDFYKFLIQKGQVHTLWGQIINKKLFENKIEALDSHLCRSEDLWANLDLYTYAKKITLIQDVLYNYRNNSNSTMRKLEKNRIMENLKSIGFVYDKLFKYIEKWKIDNDIDIVRKTALKQLHALCYESMKFFYIKNIRKKELYNIFYSCFESENMSKIRDILKTTGLKDVKIKNKIYYKLILCKKYKIIIFFKPIIVCIK